MANGHLDESKINLTLVPKLDVCVSHRIGEVKSLKFSEYCKNIECKQSILAIIQMIYDIFYQYGFYCPEIARMKDGKGLRLRWKDGDEYINTSIFFNDPTMIHYTFGNNRAIVNSESPATENGIREFLEDVKNA